MINKTPTLSIVIPTLNRRDFLKVSLNSLLGQKYDAQLPIELIVCDNASDDNTSELFNEGSEFFLNDVTFYRFDTRVDIDASFSRAISITHGDYILLFGDDDIALPGFIRHITSLIKTHHPISLLYTNRVIGDHELRFASEIPHDDNPFGIEILDSSDFIRKFTHWPGFVTCMIFSKLSWEKGKTIDLEFDGYNFLYHIYNGSKNSNMIFAKSPLILQRRGKQSWKKFWPRYWLISMPKLLNRLENDGFTKGALTQWMQYEVTHKKFLIDCIVAKAYGYRIADSFWKESRSFQRSLIRKSGSIIIQYFFPVFLAKFLYSQFGKMT